MEKILLVGDGKQNKKGETVAEPPDAIFVLVYYVAMLILSIFFFLKVKIWKERHIVYVFSQNIDFLKKYVHIIYGSWTYAKPINRTAQ